MGSSLRAGLAALQARGRASLDAAVIMLVDLPDVPAAAVERVMGQARAADPSAVLVRAAYHGVPGHPVVIGRNHFDGVIAAAVGDRGARDYLAGADIAMVECGDLAAGTDQDAPR
jgi:CTP:molybdopterin cytidylyltransferase MocA